MPTKNERNKEYERKSRKQNPEKARARSRRYKERNLEKIRKSNREYAMAKRLADPVGHMIFAANIRAKYRNRPCTITVADVMSIWPTDERCPYCRSVMERNTAMAPSLDETVIGIGYVVGNVQVICRRCNGNKSDYPLEWFEMIAGDIRRVISSLRPAISLTSV